MKHIKPFEMNWKDRFTYKKVIIADEESMSCKGSKFQMITFKPNTSLKSHHHKNVTETYYICSGKAKIILNGKTYIAKKDDVFLIEPGDTHKIIYDSKSYFTILIFKTNETKNDIY